MRQNIWQNILTFLAFNVTINVPRIAIYATHPALLYKERIYIMALKITKDNYDSVIATDKPVLIDFFAQWCGPCKMMSPIIEKIADEHPEYVVGKVDVDDDPELAQAFGVMSIPTLVVMKNGQLANQNIGAIPEDQVIALIENA